MLSDYFLLLAALVASRQGVLAANPAAVEPLQQHQQTTLGLDLSDVCPWSPFNLQQLTCGNYKSKTGQLAPPFSGSRGNRTDAARSEAPAAAPEPAPAPATWVGGRRCVGEYCLYAHRGFGQGRGIVLITDAAGLEMVKAREAQFSALYAEDQSRPQPYDIREVEGKGLGLIANRPLSRGDSLMVHAPVLLAHRGFVERTPKSEKEVLLDLAPSLMPAATRRLFMRQVGQSAGGGHKITDILTTNSFQMDIGGADGHHYGNFPEVSRFNHDCRPNAVFHVGEDLVHRTKVVRPVKPGEELTISYLDQMSSRAARQQRAQKAWGFGCSCSLCSASDADLEESEERLRVIRHLEAMLSDVKSTVTLDMVERYVALFKKESLESKMFGAYTTAALNCNLLGKDKMAAKYGQLAVEAGLMESGAGASDVEAMRTLAADPRNHFTWRRRVTG